MKSNSKKNKEKNVNKTVIHLTNIVSCRKLLSRTANMLLRNEISPDKSKAVSSLCSVFLRSFEIEQNQENINQSNVSMTPQQMAAIFTSQVNSIPLINKSGELIDRESL